MLFNFKSSIFGKVVRRRSVDYQELSRRIIHNSRLDLVLIALINIGAYLFFSYVDAFEWIVAFVESQERFELDEIVPLFLVVALSLAFFSTRRLRESRNLSSMLSELATVDSLTGIYNRREVDTQFIRQIDFYTRYKQDFSVLMLDVDFFKKINDKHGHLAGDQVLVDLAQIMENICRKTDVLGRWGGEEFIVGCPRTSYDQAMDLAERLRSKIEHSNFKGVGKVTASIGVARCQDEDDLYSLLHRADLALYQAKDQGRNRVEGVFELDSE